MRNKIYLIYSIILLLLLFLSAPVYSVVSYTKPTSTSTNTTKKPVQNYGKIQQFTGTNTTSKQQYITDDEKERYYKKYIIYLRETIMNEIPSLASYVNNYCKNKPIGECKNTVEVDLSFDDNYKVSDASIVDTINRDHYFRNELIALYQMKFKPYDKKYGSYQGFSFKLGYLSREITEWLNNDINWGGFYPPSDVYKASLAARITLNSDEIRTNITSLEIIKSSGDILFDKCFEKKYKNSYTYNINKTFIDSDEITFDIILNYDRNRDPSSIVLAVPPNATEQPPKTSEQNLNTKPTGQYSTGPSGGSGTGSYAPNPSLAPKSPFKSGNPGGGNYHAASTSQPTIKPPIAPKPSNNNASNSLVNNNSSSNTINPEKKITTYVPDYYQVIAGEYKTLKKAQKTQSKIINSISNISPSITHIGNSFVVQAGVFSNKEEAETLGKKLSNKGIEYKIETKYKLKQE